MKEVLSYRKQSIDLQNKRLGGFLYDRDLRREWVEWQMIN